MDQSSSLQQLLCQSAEGLLFPSESEFPFTYVEWQNCQLESLSLQSFLKLINKPDDTPIEITNLDKLFKRVTAIQDWYEDEEKAIAQKFSDLKKTLIQNLQNIIVYRVGEIEIDVYIIGKASEGLCAGLTTKVVET